MSYIRSRRLEKDYESMKELILKSPFMEFIAFGTPPERYVVLFRCKGLVWKSDAPAFSNHHLVEIYLGSEYPTRQPYVKWLTPIFHPNILGSDHRYNPGKVCLGKWAPSISLGDLCIKLAEMIQYKNYDTKSPLNTQAAVWADENAHHLPVDKRDLSAPDDVFDKDFEEKVDLQILE
ncbi:MAG TPA: ubiquitin-conjugating enzyme E2 [Candidatus Methanoperedens sp.]